MSVHCEAKAARVPTFRESERSSDVVFCTNTAEVVCQGFHLARTQHTHVSGCAMFVPTINFKTLGHLQLE